MCCRKTMHYRFLLQNINYLLQLIKQKSQGQIIHANTIRLSYYFSEVILYDLHSFFLTGLSISFLGGLNKNIQVQVMIIYYMIIYTVHNTYMKNGAELLNFYVNSFLVLLLLTVDYFYSFQHLKASMKILNH